MAVKVFNKLISDILLIMYPVKAIVDAIIVNLTPVLKRSRSLNLSMALIILLNK